MKFADLFAAATALAIVSAPVYASSVNPEWIAATNFSGFVTNDSGPGAFAEDCVGTGNCPGTSTPDDTRSLASVSGSFDGLNYEGSASVGTGELKLSVERGEGFADGTLEGGSVKAEIQETVHFSSDLLDNGQDDTLLWSFALDGTFEDGTFVDVIALASTTGDFSRARYQYNSTASFGVTQGTILDVTTATPSATQTTSDIITSVVNGSLVFSGALTVTAADTEVDISLSIFASGLFDFANTGTFAFNLGTGQSVTSGSGVFLTGQDLGGEDNDNPPAVPLPASLPLLLAGVLTTGLVARRSRSSTKN